MAICGCDVKLVNVVILGVSFMLIFTAFVTCNVVQQAVLNSADNGHFKGDGYTSLAIIYAVFAVANWLAPSVVTLVGPKIAMFVGSSMYFLFVMSFLKPMVWALYTGSALVGAGASLLWVGEGNFVTINSDSTTLTRNTGIFWALFQTSKLSGNLYSYFVFKNEATISDSSRTQLFAGLSVAGVLGTLCLLLLRTRSIGGGPEKVKDPMSKSPLGAFKKSFLLMKERKWATLSIVNIYLGFALTYASSVYSTCLAQNVHFGDDRKGLLGISSLITGVGNIAASGIFGLLGKKTVKHGRDPIVVVAYVMHIAAYYVAFISLPMDSPVRESDGYTYVPSNRTLALVCCFLVGFGDACYYTQMMSLIGFMYPDGSASAFALSSFVQTAAAAVGFYYSTVLQLKWQLLILVITGTASVPCFSLTEWEATKAALEKKKEGQTEDPLKEKVPSEYESTESIVTKF